MSSAHTAETPLDTTLPAGPVPWTPWATLGSKMTDLPAPAAEWLRAPTLRGRAVTLEALHPEHAADLHAGATEDTIRFLARGGPTAQTVPAWADYIERLNALPRRVNFAVRLGDGPVVGRISYSEVRAEDRWVEIGTMLLPAAQGTAVNPEAKRLLLGRAFEGLGAGRVHFKVDARNERSLRAMRRLGAVQEGCCGRIRCGRTATRATA
ncbi:GNAT family N-acetyltransferase [Deinococcus multiflagellatus]|uniref:GNAT family N-acetyltransferase n=1 Tax=Deinococcus multiflagellatus TaxID=1656887 RepID=A0ABW1ZIP1_9DEIO